MGICFEDVRLSPEERAQARSHWDALMFTPCTIDRDRASLALLKASPAVQHAVMSSINELWMQECEPQRTDNPFLPSDQKIENPVAIVESEAEYTPLSAALSNYAHHLTSSFRELWDEECALTWTVTPSTTVAKGAGQTR